MVEEKIGKRIKEFRSKKNLTQEVLAEALGLSTHHMSSLERGVYNIKLAKLVEIINLLDCSADDIFCDVTNKGHTNKEARISEEIAKLPKKEQDRIFAVLETMIEQAKK